MSRSFNLVIQDRDTGRDVRTQGEIPEADWDSLLVFANGVDELAKVQALKTRLGTGSAVRIVLKSQQDTSSPK